MPEIRCVECGRRIFIYTFATPYEGELSCPECKTKMRVYVTTGKGSRVERVLPSLDELYQIVEQRSISAERTTQRLVLLDEIIIQSLNEAAICLGYGAYTACEIMSLRALERLLRNVYNVEANLGQLIDMARQDQRLRNLVGTLDYFRQVRNKVAHPDKISSKLDAESTFLMTKRLILEIIQVIS